MSISVIQLSLYGAVADMIEELPVDQSSRETRYIRSTAKQEILTHLLLAEVQVNEQRQENLLQEYD